MALFDPLEWSLLSRTWRGVCLADLLPPRPGQDGQRDVCWGDGTGCGCLGHEGRTEWVAGVAAGSVALKRLGTVGAAPGAADTPPGGSGDNN